jgi:hypothetical protein
MFSAEGERINFLQLISVVEARGSTERWLIQVRISVMFFIIIQIPCICKQDVHTDFLVFLRQKLYLIETNVKNENIQISSTA